MELLEPKLKEMIAVGASVATNCLPCLKYHYEEAIKLGCTKQEIIEIVELANHIKQKPVHDMNQFVLKLFKELDNQE